MYGENTMLKNFYHKQGIYVLLHTNQCSNAAGSHYISTKSIISSNINVLLQRFVINLHLIKTY